MLPRGASASSASRPEAKCGAYDVKESRILLPGRPRDVLQWENLCPARCQRICATSLAEFPMEILEDNSLDFLSRLAGLPSNSGVKQITAVLWCRTHNSKKCPDRTQVARILAPHVVPG